MARPSKLTRQVRATIVGALAQGETFADACRLAGISASTAYEWLARGRGEDPRRSPTSECVAFANALQAVCGDLSHPQNRAQTGTGDLDASLRAVKEQRSGSPSAETFADANFPTLKKGLTGREWLSQRSRSRSIIDREF